VHSSSQRSRTRHLRIQGETVCMLADSPKPVSPVGARHSVLNP
jgi:hypothetical protein